ncbi:amicyanin [Microvirga sp. c23x22]|uniref:Amicyanin n=2 Tax=Microvirga terricola TaxID=2719797 RepID=A0ABX0V9R2_9HYPH|nr:amicyanin [Microvirga terricola]
MMLAAIFTIAGVAYANAAVIRVQVSNYRFNPPQIVAHVGDTIQWVSSDVAPHTATARNGTWDLPIPSGQSGSIILTGAGTIDYYCRYHPNMVGRITVLKGRAR